MYFRLTLIKLIIFLLQNCLRALVIKLFEKKERRKLVQFAYGDMQQDFVEILEERARSCEVPLVQPTQYDLLYAFHVYRNNYRKGKFLIIDNLYLFINC